LLGCHRPRKRTIQYPRDLAFATGATAYWIPRLRGV
jgi:hypothetical protein